MKKQTVINSINVPNSDIDILKKHFSYCFDKNDNFDLEKFKSELSKNEIDFSNESYGMDWLGKSYARLLASDEATTLLKEDKKWNAKPQNVNSQNLLLKGDNLEVLKHLSSAYYEKVKMIYVDPPYNTGSDGFVYQDDRKFTVEEFRKLAGVDEEKAKRILDFVDSKSNSHSAWLTFMYPRLYIAKQLLKEDGVIFVSIDDNEVAQLRIAMDEVFGEENFVSEFIWEKKKKPSFLHSNVGKLSEYIVCYVKNNINTFPFSIENTTTEKKYPLNNAGNSKSVLTFPAKSVEFSLPDMEVTPQDMSNGNIITKLLDRVIIRNGYNTNEFRLEGEWRYSQSKLNNILEKNEKITISNIPFRPNHIKSGGEIKKMKNQFSPVHYEMETNEDATQQIISLFGVNIFDNPKPTKLIKTLVKAVTYMDRNALILDFFAGSGTTGDAVMQLNAEEGEEEYRRKYILVQLPEEIDEKKDKVAFDFVKNELGIRKPTIFDITKERLLRAGKKIQEDNKIVKEPKDLSNVDFGFKVFETTPIWDGYDLDAEDFDSQMELFNENKLSDEDLQTLLVTWKTYDGVPLTQNVVSINLDGYIAFYLGTRLYLMNKGFGTKNLKRLLDEIDVNNDFNPRTVIVFGYNFESKILRELEENIKNYANKKEIEIDFIARY